MALYGFQGFRVLVQVLGLHSIEEVAALVLVGVEQDAVEVLVHRGGSILHKHLHLKDELSVYFRAMSFSSAVLV